MTGLAGLQHFALQANANLAKYTVARIGGDADWLYVARDSLEELVQVVKTAWKENLPVRVIGGGANILVSDKGVRGLVIINHLADVDFGNWHDGRTVSATAGTGILSLARQAAQRGLTGMEWAVGVPGTLGGAIVNNAGAHGSEMANIVGDVVVLEPGGPKMYSNAEMQYEYRYSALKARTDRRYMVLLATLCLPSDDPDAILARMNEYNAYRKRTQPPGASLGSIFKNPPGDYAGRLIESCGLKGYTIGSAQVSPVHANFFINTGSTTAADYYTLIQHVRTEVARKTGVELELEVELVGEW